MSLPPRQAKHAAYSSDNELVRVTLPGLIRLSQAASALRLGRSDIRSAQSGNYFSRFKGRGMEFDETRPYAQGDDIRHLDWRVTARTGKTHTKLFREERERPIYICVDARSAMFFATRGRFKSVQAANMAALVAWHALRHGDRIGGQVFTETSTQEFKPEHGRGAVLRFLQHLADLESPKHYPARDQGFDEILARLIRHARPGSLVFIFSDFRQLSPQGESSLIRLSRHCDLALVFISDPLERSLPSSGHYRFGDGLRELSLTASAEAARMHAQQFEQRLQNLSNLARQHRLRLISCCTTDDPLTRLQQVGRKATQR